MPEFATVRRPDMNELKFKYEHARDKKFYVKPRDEHKIDIILGDNTYCKIKTEKISREARRAYRRRHHLWLGDSWGR